MIQGARLRERRRGSAIAVFVIGQFLVVVAVIVAVGVSVGVTVTDGVKASVGVSVGPPAPLQALKLTKQQQNRTNLDICVGTMNP